MFKVRSVDYPESRITICRKRGFFFFCMSIQCFEHLKRLCSTSLHWDIGGRKLKSWGNRTSPGDKENLILVVCVNWPFKTFTAELKTSLNCIKYKACCYIGSVSLRWPHNSGNLQWSAVYGWLFSLMNSRPCTQCVCECCTWQEWLLHSCPLSLKDDRGKLIFASPLDSGWGPPLRTWGPHKRPVSATVCTDCWTLDNCNSPCKLLHLALAAHDGGVTPHFLERAPERMRRNNCLPWQRCYGSYGFSWQDAPCRLCQTVNPSYSAPHITIFQATHTTASMLHSNC